jgi:hypothetical protein
MTDGRCVSGGPRTDLVPLQRVLLPQRHHQLRPSREGRAGVVDVQGVLPGRRPLPSRPRRRQLVDHSNLRLTLRLPVQQRPPGPADELEAGIGGRAVVGEVGGPLERADDVDCGGRGKWEGKRERSSRVGSAQHAGATVGACASPQARNLQWPSARGRRVRMKARRRAAALNRCVGQTTLRVRRPLRAEFARRTNRARVPPATREGVAVIQSIDRTFRHSSEVACVRRWTQNTESTSQRAQNCLPFQTVRYDAPGARPARGAPAGCG